MFKINDIVTVKPGIEDPDFGGDIGGWQGRIMEIDNSDPQALLIEIAWDADDDWGVIGDARCNNKRMRIPLCDIEVLDRSDTTQALEDCIVWFANR